VDIKSWTVPGGMNSVIELVTYETGSTTSAFFELKNGRLLAVISWEEGWNSRDKLD
jgi:hypothetical protein